MRGPAGRTRGLCGDHRCWEPVGGRNACAGPHRSSLEHSGVLKLGLAKRCSKERRVVLIVTESGRRLSVAARRALAAYSDALRQSIDTTPRGMLRITAALIFGRRHVTPVVASFL